MSWLNPIYGEGIDSLFEYAEFALEQVTTQSDYEDLEITTLRQQKAESILWDCYEIITSSKDFSGESFIDLGNKVRYLKAVFSLAKVVEFTFLEPTPTVVWERLIIWNRTVDIYLEFIYLLRLYKIPLDQQILEVLDLIKPEGRDGCFDVNILRTGKYRDLDIRRQLDDISKAKKKYQLAFSRRIAKLRKFWNCKEIFNEEITVLHDVNEVSIELTQLPTFDRLQFDCDVIHLQMLSCTAIFNVLSIAEDLYTISREFVSGTQWEQFLVQRDAAVHCMRPSHLLRHSTRVLQESYAS